MSAEPEPRLSDLVSGAVSDLQTLVTGQIELAKVEMAQSAKRGARGGGLIGLAIFMALFALLMLAFSAAFGLVAAGLSNWAAFLVIGVLMLLITAALGLVARREFMRMTGPTLAQEELAKTQQLFVDQRAAAAEALSFSTLTGQAPDPAPEADPRSTAKQPESATVFPSYSGTPPTP